MGKSRCIFNFPMHLHAVIATAFDLNSIKLTKYANDNMKSLRLEHKFKFTNFYFSLWQCHAVSSHMGLKNNFFGVRIT